MMLKIRFVTEIVFYGTCAEIEVSTPIHAEVYYKFKPKCSGVGSSVFLTSAKAETNTLFSANMKTARLYTFPLHFNTSVMCSQGTRYIVMGQIYHRRRHLPSDLLNLLGGKLKPGDGLLRSNNYVKRFNKRRHQKALEATRSRCR